MITRFQFIAALLLLAGCGRRGPAELAGAPERIISLAPNITEMLYALDLGDKLVGATTYCVYPDAAKSVPRVGGFGQYNFEAIVSLKPDLVILHHNHAAEKARLDGLGIPHLEIRDERLADIAGALRDIGAACGAEDAANQLVAKIKARTARAPNPQTAPRVLLTFGDAAEIDPIHAFGADCLHNELLELAGGKNAVGAGLPFSTLSKEAVIRLNPEIIIQLAPGATAPANPAAAWSDLSGVDAVRNHRVYVLTGDHTCIPGPRVLLLLDDLNRIIRQNDFVAE